MLRFCKVYAVMHSTIAQPQLKPAAAISDVTASMARGQARPHAAYGAHLSLE